MSKPLTSSKTVIASYSPPKKGSAAALEFSIPKRPPSVLSYGTNAPQGDHVTAYRLIEEGLYRWLDGLTVDEVENLFSLENRDSLRARRSGLYDYVSAIAVLDPTRKVSLYLALDNILLSYHKERYKKTEIRKHIEEFHEVEDLTGSAYEQALKAQEAKFRENGEKIRIVFQEIAALLVTFYNKIPHTAYHYIEGFKEEAGDIKVSKTKIQEVLNWLDMQSEDEEISSIALATKRPQIVEVMNSLIHYEEITVKKKLEDHIAENLTKKGKTNQPRNNSKETLIMLLARHIHIVFAVYPQLKTFNQDNELVNDFIDKFIGKGEEHPNWPSFTKTSEIKSIKEGVKNEIARLDASLLLNHYNVWRAAKITSGVELDSSEDEEIEITPKKKIKPKAAKKLSFKEEEMGEEEMLKELAMLRKMKAVILDNRDSIPEEVMQEIDGILSSKNKGKAVAKAGKGRE